MDFAVVRENAARGYGKGLLSRGQRGYRIGKIELELGFAAVQIGLDVSLRAARIALANEVFGDVATYSQLSGDELLALEMWTRTGEVAEWLAEEYGAMGKLPGL